MVASIPYEMPEVLHFEVSVNQSSGNACFTSNYLFKSDPDFMVEQINEIAKTIVLNSVAGAVVGFVVGGVGGAFLKAASVVYQSKAVWQTIKTLHQTKQVIEMAKKGVIVGVIIGGTSGGVVGTYKSIKFHQDIKIINAHVTQDSASKEASVVNIVNAIINKEIETMETKNVDMVCPLTHQPFVIPVETRCEHVFEFIPIINWLQTHSSCPTCRRDIRIEELTYSQPTVNSIQMIAQLVFSYLEGNIRSHIPISSFSYAPNLYNRKFVAQVAREIERDSLLNNEEEIVDKILNNALSKKEVYTHSS